MSDHILEFWNSQAKRFGTAHTASWGDKYAIALEIETIGEHILAGDRVLDVGCSNGYSVLHHLDRHVAGIVGVDFSEAMIREAQARRQECASPDRVSFEVGDIRKLRFEDGAFDFVYTTRTLINVPTWEEQKQGIRECLRVCRPGGTVVVSEAFWEPLVLLNAMRSLKALPALVETDFNRYLKKGYLEDFLLSLDVIFENVDFSSVYYLGTRFLSELVTETEGHTGYENRVNSVFYELEKEFSGGGFGIQQAYVIRKKEAC